MFAGEGNLFIVNTGQSVRVKPWQSDQQILADDP